MIKADKYIHNHCDQDENEKIGKLPKIFKEKLVKALESGEYKKCKGTLKRKTRNSNYPYKYCVMGVVGKIGGAKIEEGGSCSDDFETKGRVPKALLGTPLEEILIDMNDSGESFEDMAEWIDKTL